jgi:pyridoxamine 5'-phosphate oxidase
MSNPTTAFGEDIGLDDPVEDPLDLLDLWLAPVGAQAGATDMTTTPLMALATVGPDGAPRLRHVLLSSYDRGRLHFHTDARTAKSAELAADPRVAATIVWPEIPRQLTVLGSVAAEDGDEQARAFAQRTRYLQLLAWVNDHELAQRSAAERAAAWAAYDEAHGTLAPPPTWSGYVIVAQQITFWRGGYDAPSQRIFCRQERSGWHVERLPG